MTFVWTMLALLMALCFSVNAYHLWAGEGTILHFLAMGVAATAFVFDVILAVHEAEE